MTLAGCNVEGDIHFYFRKPLPIIERRGDSFSLERYEPNNTLSCSLDVMSLHVQKISAQGRKKIKEENERRRRRKKRRKKENEEGRITK